MNTELKGNPNIWVDRVAIQNCAIKMRETVTVMMQTYLTSQMKLNSYSERATTRGRSATRTPHVWSCRVVVYLRVCLELYLCPALLLKGV